jgi:hypothetical protein
MSTVDFTIDGLAACYLKPDGTRQIVWNIVFPCDAVHEANLWYTINGEEIQKPIPLVNKTTKIFATKPTNLDSFYEPSFINNTLNLSGSYLHSKGVKKVQNPSIKQSLMTIANAGFYMKEKRDKIIAFSKPLNPVKYPDVKKFVGFEMTKTIGGRIEIPIDESVVIDISGINAITLPATGSSFRIDNHCPNNCGENDFDLYSKLFHNSEFDDKSYTVETGSLSSSFEIQTNDKGGISILTANPPAFCDGIIIDPPPGT